MPILQEIRLIISLVCIAVKCIIIAGTISYKVPNIVKFNAEGLENLMNYPAIVNFFIPTTIG